MMGRLDTLRLAEYAPTKALQIGWSKFNLTPAHTMPMAGYKPRKHFVSVHDSIYTRIVAIDNGQATAFIISMDLMLFPPALKQRLEEKLREQGKNYFLYLTATHTHSSIGGWDDSLLGQFALGNYDALWIDETVKKILAHINKAKADQLPSHLSYLEADASRWVENRLDKANGQTDGIIRGLQITRSDSSRGYVVSFSAHPTTISNKSLELSGDYPNAWVADLEKGEKSFALFMAGMVGSHRISGFEGNGFDIAKAIGDTLAIKVLEAKPATSDSSLPIKWAHIPVEHGGAQLRIAKNWKVRNWLFSAFLGPLKAEITVLEIGNLMLVGIAGDFSGEIYVHDRLGQLAKAKGKELIITSFNGGYTGYITLDKYYDTHRDEEVTTTNWVGPYFGEYYSEIMQKIIKASD